MNADGQPRVTPSRSVWVRAVISVVTIAFIALAAVTPATAHPDDTGRPGALVMRNCHEFAAFPDVPYDKADELVPGFTVKRDDLDHNGFGTLEDPTARTAKLLITSRRCDTLEVDGKKEDDVIESYIAVFIEPPEPGPPHVSRFGPSGTDLSLTSLETYIVQWATTSDLRAAWLRQGTGLADDTVMVVDDLVFDYNPFPEHIPGAVDEAFTVRVQSVPSPYSIEARVTEPGPVPWDLYHNQWWDTPVGTMISPVETKPNLFGPAEGVVTSDDPDSPLGETFGAEQSRATGGDADKGILVDPVSFGFYAQGEWTKCVRRASGDCIGESN